METSSNLYERVTTLVDDAGEDLRKRSTQDPTSGVDLAIGDSRCNRPVASAPEAVAQVNDSLK